MIIRFRSFLFFLLFLSLSKPGVAQTTSEAFGKNRIQRKNLKWSYIATQNFDVYYYGKGKDLAIYAARQAEENYDRISNTIGFSPYSKVKLMVYSSIADLNQSNIGLEDPEVLVGGSTNFVKSRVEVAFRGTRAQFNTDINKGIANVIINVMMYGGSLKDVVQSSYLLALPDWFLEGASRYIAEGWNMEMDNYARDLFIYRDHVKPAHLEGREAYLVGHSIWNFIAKKYGEDNIANILNLTRIARDERESIESTLGMPFQSFVAEWEDYYKGMASQVANDYQNVNKENRIKRNSAKKEFRNLVVNNGGSKIAYSVHRRGKYKILITDSLHHKSKVISKGGYKLIDQPENLNTPLLSWATDKTIAYIKTKNDKTWLRLYDTESKKRLKILIDDVDEVLGMDFSDNGKFAIISGVKNGQSDIFQYDVFRNRMRQVTNDAYDDIQPKYIDTTLNFVFSSNRISDTLSNIRNAIITPQNKFNIYRFDADSSKKVLQKLSFSGNNYQPTLYGEDILYLSDRKGIYNLFRHSDIPGKSKQITNFVKNISIFNSNERNHTLIFTMLDKGRENIYSIADFNFEKSYNTPLTPRQSYFDSGKNKKNEFVFKSQDIPVKDQEMDVNEFSFESDTKKHKQKEKEKAAQIAKNNSLFTKEFKFVGPYRYKNRFSLDKMASTIKIDPLRGLGIYIEGGMGDMLGNHKMNAGYFQTLDLRSNGLYGEYIFLKRRIDIKARFERQTYNFSTTNTDQRYVINNIIGTASYPLSVFDRISLSPFITHTRFATLDFALNTPDVITAYVGLRAEYVYDNTEVTGMNMIEGTKLKVSLEQYTNTQSSSLNFGKFIMDLRHYQPIHKEIVFATRLSVGSFLGPSKKTFIVGGMNNWLFNSTTHEGTNDPVRFQDYTNNSDILFAQYVTSLRGFNYNTVFGSKYLLFNAELRIPIIRYLYKGTISSNFFRNLQLIGFTDVGASWSGNNPFNKDNNINKRVVVDGNGALTSTIINYKNPFLTGYGMGARTLFLGYYVKFDVGWGILNSVRQQPRYYLTLGYDF